MRAILSFFSFYGRTRRTVYGVFSLALIPVFTAFVVAAPVAFLQIYGKTIFDDGTPSGTEMMRTLGDLAAIPHQAVLWTAIVSGVVWLVMLVAWTALCVRRLHDMGGTGLITIAFFGLMFLLSVFGYFLVCLVLSVWPGTKGTNRYGRDPRHADDIADVFADSGRPA